jgi:hypothetical protein
MPSAHLYVSGQGTTCTCASWPAPPGPQNLYGDRGISAMVWPWYAPAITAACVASGLQALMQGGGGGRCETAA